MCPFFIFGSNKTSRFTQMRIFIKIVISGQNVEPAGQSTQIQESRMYFLVWCGTRGKHLCLGREENKWRKKIRVPLPYHISSLMRAKRSVTTFLRPSHMLLIFSSGPPLNARPYKIISFKCRIFKRYHTFLKIWLR